MPSSCHTAHGKTEVLRFWITLLFVAVCVTCTQNKNRAQEPQEEVDFPQATLHISMYIIHICVYIYVCIHIYAYIYTCTYTAKLNSSDYIFLFCKEISFLFPSLQQQIMMIFLHSYGLFYQSL